MIENHARKRPEPLITALEDRHATAVRQLYKKSVGENKAGFIQDLSFHGDIIDQAKKIEQQGGVFWVVLLERQLVGFGALKPTDTPGVVELCKLHVSSDVQSKGIGKSLSLALIDHARDSGAREVSLHVTVSQTAALALYRKLGFQKTGQEVFETRLGDAGQKQIFDTVFMTLAL
ncbi:MAG: N-acetyltransferase family protein [Pseudomonadota bacterium]